MHTTFLFLFSSLFVSWASSAATKRQLHSSELCASSCQRTISSLTFAGAKSSCQNILFSQSLYLCTEVYCSAHNTALGLAYLNQTCILRQGPMPPFSIVAGFTAAQIDAVRRIDITQVKSLGKSVNTTVVPSPAYYRTAYMSVASKRNAVVRSEYYGYAMYAFWALVVSVSIFNQLVHILTSLRRDGPLIDAEGVMPRQAARKVTAFGRVLHLLRQHLTVPATFGHKRAQPIGWCTVPTRIQSLTIGLFVLLNVVSSLVDYPIFDGNMIYVAKKLQLAQYIGDRTGLLCMTNLPLVWIFSSRNDVLLWVTGWTFATFNRFHRWVARVAVAQVVAHGVAYTFQLIYQKGYPKYISTWKESWFYTGVIALCLMALLLPLSAYGLRTRHYEVFLYTHITAAVGILVGIFYHVAAKQGYQYNAYLWACVAIWSFDRVLRIVRVLLLNIPGRRTQARVTYDAEGDVVRLEVEPTLNITPRPGTYYYIYVLRGWHFYQSHPFTLSSWRVAPAAAEPSAEPSATPSLDVARVQHEKKFAIASVTPLPSSSLSSLTTLPSSTKPTLTFLIRPFTGFTRRLCNAAQRTGTTTTIPILIEGPYGVPAAINTFPNVLYVVGGTGITVALAYLRASASVCAARSEKLVWIARQRSLVANVAARELADLAQLRRRTGGPRLDVHAYVTTGGEQEKTEAMANVDALSTARPDVEQVVLREAERVRSDGDGKLAVVVCGPAGLADDVRRACVRALGLGYGGVWYFEESFTW